MNYAWRYLLGYDNLIDAATIGGLGSWETSAPDTNVGTWALADTARTTDVLATSTKLLVDHGSAKAKRVFALMGDNASSAATIRIKCGTTPGGAEVLDTGAISRWHFSPLAGHVGALYEAIIPLDAEVSSRYDTIEIVDTTNPAGYLDVGRLFIGRALAFTWNPRWGLREGHADLSKVGLAYGGADWPQVNRRPRTVSFEAGDMTLSEGDLALEIEQLSGLTGEVLFAPYVGVPARMQRAGMVGQMRALDGVGFPVYNTRSKAFSIRQRV